MLLQVLLQELSTITVLILIQITVLFMPLKALILFSASVDDWGHLVAQLG